MNISQQQENEDNTPKLRTLELYIVTQNQRLEKLIADYDVGSRIDLSCQKLIDSDMGIIVKYAVLEKKCQSLNLWGNKFTYKSLSILANILNENQTLEELDLSHNRLTDRGVEILSEVLSLDNCRIKEIDLSSNDITDIGARYLSNMLRNNTQIKSLILNKNEITNDGLIVLGNALVHHNKILKELKIESNRYITRTGVIELVNLLKNHPTLEEIYVKDCSISGKDFHMLEQLGFTTGFDIIV